MDITVTGLLLNCVPNLPKLLKTALLSSIGQSENSNHQDALTETIVVAARPVLQTPAPIKKAQNVFNTDHGVFGRMWISKYTIPGPSKAVSGKESLDVRGAVELGITTLQSSHNMRTPQSCPCPISEQREVETEWTAYRKGVSHIATLPKNPQAELYREMMKDVPPNGPTAAKAEHWIGAPPVYVCVGWEGMQDEVEVFARKVYVGNKGGAGRVVFDGYEGMPHCFAMFPWNRVGWKAMRSWAGFCKVVVDLNSRWGDMELVEKGGERAGPSHGDNDIRTRLTDPLWKGVATWMSSKTMAVKTVKVEDLGLTNAGSGYRILPLADEEVGQRLHWAMKWRVELEEKMLEQYSSTHA